MTIITITDKIISGERFRTKPVCPAGSVVTFISQSADVYIVEWNGMRFSMHIDNLKITE